MNNFNSDSVKLNLVLIPAFANEPGKMIINIKEKSLFNNPKPFSIKDNFYENTTLYPGIERTLNCDFSKPEEFIPDEAAFFGKIYFESEISKKIKYEIPVYLIFEEDLCLQMKKVI